MGAAECRRTTDDADASNANGCNVPTDSTAADATASATTDATSANFTSKISR